MKELGRGGIKGGFYDAPVTASRLDSMTLESREVLRLKVLETLTSSDSHFTTQQHSETRLPSWNKDQAK